MEQYLTYIIYGVIIVYILIQCFLSFRPLFFPGLILPLCILAVWLVITKHPQVVPFGLTLSDTTRPLFNSACRISLLIGLLVYALCRVWLMLSANIGARRRRWRLEAKRKYQQKEAALLEKQQERSSCH